MGGATWLTAEIGSAPPKAGACIPWSVKIARIMETIAARCKGDKARASAMNVLSKAPARSLSDKQQNTFNGVSSGTSSCSRNSCVPVGVPCNTTAAPTVVGKTSTVGTEVLPMRAVVAKPGAPGPAGAESRPDANEATPSG